MMDLEDFRRLVECPICMEVPVDSIMYNCKNCHNICTECFDALPSQCCPIGRTCGYVFTITNGIPTPQRNRTVEGILEQFLKAESPKSKKKERKCDKSTTSDNQRNPSVLFTIASYAYWFLMVCLEKTATGSAKAIRLVLSSPTALWALFLSAAVICVLMLLYIFFYFFIFLSALFLCLRIIWKLSVTSPRGHQRS